MAKQESTTRFTGTIDGITFYHHKLYGPLARKKGGPNAKQIKTNAAFTRLRENGKEFGACGKTAGFLRRALQRFSQESGDKLVVPRLTRILMLVKNQDAISARGKRSVGTGIGVAAGKALLNGFDFNGEAPLGDILKKDFALNMNTGGIGISSLQPKRDLNRPRGATHVRFRSLWLRMNLNSGKFELFESAAIMLPVNTTSSNITLSPNGLPGISGTNLYLLQICFYQEVNSVMYALNNGEYNCMRVVGVS